MTPNTARMILCALAAASALAACKGPSPTYRGDIRALLDAHCVACHLPGQPGFERSGLRLDSYDALMKGTRTNPVVRPGSSVSSTLYRLLAGRLDPSIRMPHGDARLSDAEIAMIGTWIDQGATY